MNPAAILTLISTLYEQVASLTEENAHLRQALEEQPVTPACPVAGNEWSGELAEHVLACPHCDHTFKDQAKVWLQRHGTPAAD